MTNGTRLGGKLESTESGSPNMRTDFTFQNKITKVEILGAGTFGTAGMVTKIYLQSSTDGETWTTVKSITNVTEILVFDELDIQANSYIKIAIELTASNTNSGLYFTGIKVYGLIEYNPAREDIEAIPAFNASYSVATNLDLYTVGTLHSSCNRMEFITSWNY